MKTVKDIYKSLRSSDYMLSQFGADFWLDYRNNHTTYDRLFTRMYKGFSPWEQERNEDIADIRDNFIQSVRDILQLNEKEFSELYRIHVMPNTEYSLSSDFKSTEIMDKDTTSTFGQRVDSFSSTSGARTDDYQNVKGTQSDSTTEQVAPFDSESFSNNTKTTLTEGQRSDSGTSTKGIQNDSGSNTQGAHNDSYTEDYTLTKEGYNNNPLENIKKHKDFWSKEDFYAHIFGVIAEELLIIE